MTDLKQLLRSAEPVTEPSFDAPDVARRVHRRARRRVLATATSTTVVVAVIAVLGFGRGDLWRPPADVMLSPPTGAAFVGTWVATDDEGSSRTMTIERAGDEFKVVARVQPDAVACSEASSTMSGTARPQTNSRLVIAAPYLTCDDGTTPAIGSPPQAALANFTLELDAAAGEVLDSAGVVWQRASASATSDADWPQATRDEVTDAQERADAGDPDYTWQLDATLATGEQPWGAEIFSRFIEEELGWEAFAGASFAGHMSAPGGYESVLFIRCAPGQTNPLSTLYVEAPPEIRRCAPTIDESTYESVGISLTQPGRRGPSGIWVVDRWEILGPKPLAFYELLGPDYLAPKQVQQVPPPSDADVDALLRAFLQARVDGTGAEQHLLTDPKARPEEVPLLYGTTSGAPYERFETERLQGPVWPNGWMEYKVRLFAEGDTVVEQRFHVTRQDEQLGLVYGQAYSDALTTENGKAVPVEIREFGDTVSFTAAPPVTSRGDGSVEVTPAAGSEGRIVLAVDPMPWGQDCYKDPDSAPSSDTRALVRTIRSDPAFEVSETGSLPFDFDGRQMDATFTGKGGSCYELWSPEDGSADSPSWRMRLYLIEYPESSVSPSESGWNPQVLTVAVIAPEPDFERVLEEATSIVETLEFHQPE